MLYVVQTALELGFMYALVAMALFLSYRILDIADMTTDSGFVLGAAVSVTCAAALDPATAEKVLELTKKIVAKNHTTCLMVTHNMQQALTMGNRTLMMDDGRIVFDVKGEERSRMTVPDLLEKFRIGAGKELDNDRILLSAED